jgi:anti-sigma-K factor RskA
MDKERFLSSGLLEQYVLGLTTPEESEQVERYLRDFPELQAQVDAMQQAIEQYAMQHSIPPAGRFEKGRTVAFGVRGRHSGKRREAASRASDRWKVFFTATTIFFALLSLLLYQQQRQAIRAYDQLHARFALLNEKCDADNKRLTETVHLYAFLADPDTRQIRLTGTQLAPQASLLVYWNEKKQRAGARLIDLPAAPPGQQYQFWADVGGEMKSLGLLHPDSSDVQPLDFVPAAQSLNITLEPAGGSARPSTEKRYATAEF